MSTMVDITTTVFVSWDSKVLIAKRMCVQAVTSMPSAHVGNVVVNMAILVMATTATKTIATVIATHMPIVRMDCVPVNRVGMGMVTTAMRLRTLTITYMH